MARRFTTEKMLEFIKQHTGKTFVVRFTEQHGLWQVFEVRADGTEKFRYGMNDADHVTTWLHGYWSRAVEGMNPRPGEAQPDAWDLN